MKLEDGRTNSRSKALTLKLQESDRRTNGLTQEIVPPKNDLRSLKCGGKRILKGGLDSPSKRLRSMKT
jgi:hypothetical protein